jgi:hypothetical protein
LERIVEYSDDVLAVCGCVLAVIACGGLMCLSPFLGQWRNSYDARGAEPRHARQKKADQPARGERRAASRKRAA